MIGFAPSVAMESCAQSRRSIETEHAATHDLVGSEDLDRWHAWLVDMHQRHLDGEMAMLELHPVLHWLVPRVAAEKASSTVNDAEMLLGTASFSLDQAE